MASLALIAAGTGSAGGLGAFLVKKLRKRGRAQAAFKTPQGKATS